MFGKNAGRKSFSNIRSEGGQLTMPTPGEHKTVQARILEYAEAIGWTIVSREEAEQRRGFDPDVPPADRAKNRSLFFDDLLDAKVREFNPRYAEAEGALLGQFRHLHTDIYGNREFVEHLRNRGKFFDHEEKRERDLILIDYDDPARNVYEVTEEWAFHNGHYGTREDVVFLINGIPVLVIECKNANKDEAIALGVDQIRRYHRETPELFVSQQLFTATDAIGFSYGVSWNTVRRNIFNWKDEEVGKLEAKVKSFCAIPQVLAFLKDYIVFAEKDEELNKYILRQHQTGAVEATVSRALDPKRTRGLVWHTQGSGKTFTMIKTAERLFRAPEADKPTILLMIDRNELEDQMLKNLAALGLGNLEHAGSIARLNQLLKDDYRGIIVTMIHKFRDMPANLNTRSNIYVLIDEAHRTTGGDLGNFLMAGLPNATFLGFTGTPVDKTVYGKGTFKTFGCEDDQGYLHKYSIADSIEDGTTLPLYYQLAPNEMLVPHETLDKEFLSLAEAEGVADIEELNKILERAVNLKNFLKGKERIQKVAEFVAKHYLENVEPLGYKAFLVGVDREACALLQEGARSSPAARVFRGRLHRQQQRLGAAEGIPPRPEEGAADSQELRQARPDAEDSHRHRETAHRLRRARALRHVSRQADARPHAAAGHRPGEPPLRERGAGDGEAPRLRPRFRRHLRQAGKGPRLRQRRDQRHRQGPEAPEGALPKQDGDQGAGVSRPASSTTSTTRTWTRLIEHFRDPERRKEFFKEYKEIEMLYEIISPDAFLRPFIDDYATLSNIYLVVRNAYARRVYVDRDFQKKTNELVQEHVGAEVGYGTSGPLDLVEINADTIKLIKEKRGGEGTKVINLIKSIEKAAEEHSDDPFLIAMAERAQAVQESFEQRQTSTADALESLLKDVERNETRKKEQAEKGFDGLTFFVYRTLLDAKVGNAEAASKKIKEAFVANPNWKKSEAALRELRKKVTFAVFAEVDDLDAVTRIVDDLFTLLEKADRI